MRNEKYIGRMKKGIMTECVLVIILMALVLGKRGELIQNSSSGNVLSVEGDYIKWVDFTVSYEALCQAYDWDVETHGTEYEINWVELLAYTAARTGGKFDKDALKIMEKAAEKLAGGESTLEELTEELNYYPYYKEAYSAAIGGLVGEYWEETDAGGNDSSARGQTNEGMGNGGKDEDTGNAGNTGSTEDTGNVRNIEDAGKAGYVERYGLKGYFPLARGFDYTHYDDFGAGRSYGYARKHLG